MSKYFNKLLIPMVLLAIYSCSKDKDHAPQTDKQIRFDLPSMISYDNSPKITEGQSNLYKFNIDYFSGVDSVIYSFWSSVTGVNNKCTVELFNVTDNTPVAGSRIEVPANTITVLYQSGNIIRAFPHKEITLGIRIKGEVDGNAVNATSCQLYLYRK